MTGLTISQLRLDVRGRGHDIVGDIDLVIEPGTVLGLVGESGCGKTTVGLAALGHTRRGVELSHGEVRVGVQPLVGVERPALRALRGKSISYVPQDPGSALNPALRIGKQIRQVLDAHDFGNSSDARRARVTEVLDEVLLPSTSDFLRRYPHQLSGGEQQRVALAMAFACRPRSSSSTSPPPVSTSVRNHTSSKRFTTSACTTRWQLCTSRMIWPSWPRSPTAWR